MATQRSNYNLFGIDLLAVVNDWRQGLVEAMQWPLFERLFPPQPVCLVGPDGEVLAGYGGTVREGPQRARHLAILLPDALVLRRTVLLPPLSSEAQRQALALELQAVSPFPSDALAWGCVLRPAAQGIQAELALASRKHIQAHIAGLGSVLGDRLPEVWASVQPPIVLTGFGEARRLAQQRRSRLSMIALAAGALFLCLLLAASPVLQKRARAIDAAQRFETLSREVAPVVAQREALGRLGVHFQAVAAYAAGRADPRGVLARLSALLPDTAYLTRFELRGDAVTAGGIAANAAAVLDMLGSQADFIDLRAPGAITRDASSGRETFLVEFRLAASTEGGAP